MCFSAEASFGMSAMRMVLGSVADKIIREAASPVLVYHPAG